MSEMVHITINKQPLEVPAGTRIIEAAKMLNIDIHVIGDRLLK